MESTFNSTTTKSLQMKANESKISLQELPYDIKILLFSYFDAAILAKLAIVSKEFKQMSEEPSLWKSLWERDKEKWGRIENIVSNSKNTSLKEFFTIGMLNPQISPAAMPTKESDSWKENYLRFHLQNLPQFAPTEDGSLFQMVRSTLKNPFGKTYSIPMFGEGLEGGAAKGLLYELMYNQASPFKMTGLYPGVEGIGSGVGFTINNVKVSLSAMYKYEDRGVFDKVRPIWTQFFKSASAFIFVVDTEQQIEDAKYDLNSFVDEAYGVSMDAPLLVLSFYKLKKISTMEVVNGLGLNEGQMKLRRWQVMMVEVDNMKGIWEGLIWLTSKIHL